MTLRLHNTLSRSIEPFEPLQPGRVSLYTCGPTVYNYAHVGNFRTFLFEDLLRRWLEASGFDVFHVMNLTDVDDKTIRDARAAGQTLREYTERYIAAFGEDRRWLRIVDASTYPRATDYIGAMIALVNGLLEKGIAYKSDDGSVYFAIARYPAYGRLSRLDTRELRAGASARTRSDEYAKEDARDFALWKTAEPDDESVGAAWDAPFGRGRPGWHLECSAMALELVGEKFGTRVLDIHAGGVDLIFPHHEDEIAQSCAFTGEPSFARYWLHGEFLNLEGTKMSKRYGNILTVRDLREQGVDPGAVRLLMFGTHYRKTLDWSDAALRGAQEGASRLGTFRDRLGSASAAGGPDSEESAGAAADFTAAFTGALNDDLNAPQALAALFELLRAGNRILDQARPIGPRFREAWALADRVLAVFPTGKSVEVSMEAPLVAEEDGIVVHPPERPPAEADAAEEWARRWALVRIAEKRKRNFSEADRIRDLLRRAGFELRDRRDGKVEVARGGWAESDR